MSGPRLSIIPRLAIVDSRLTATALRVLCILGSHTDSNGWCSRSQGRVADELGCSRTAVNGAIKKLVECGYVQQRALVRKDGGDRSHEYRVLLDEIQPSEFINDIDVSAASSFDDASSDFDPCQIGDTPVSSLNEHPGVTSGLTPNRTIPSSSERKEREARAPTVSGSEVRAKLEAGAERAALAETARADDAFMSQFRQWPKHDTDNIVRSHGSWLRLSEADRAAASTAVPVFIAKLRIDKAHCRFFTFIEERKWLDLTTKPGAASPNSVLLTIDPGTDLWWAVFWRRWKAGERVKFMFDQAFPIGSQPRQGIGVPAGAVPKPGETGALVTIALRDKAGAVTPEFRAWAERMAKDFLFRFNANDLRMPFIKVPSEWPPGLEGMSENGEGNLGKASGY